MPAARAAVSREPPSSTSARASIRRAARASRHRAASRRSSPAPSSRRVIATTIGPLPTGPYRRINRRGPRDAPGTRPVRNNGRWYNFSSAPDRLRQLDKPPRLGDVQVLDQLAVQHRHALAGGPGLLEGGDEAARLRHLVRRRPEGVVRRADLLRVDQGLAVEAELAALAA